MTKDNTFSCVRIVAILMMAVSFSPQRMWGQSGSWAGNCAATFSTYDSENKNVTITSAGELALLAKNVGTEGISYEGYTFVLSTNIDLSAHYWVPIGTGANAFNGTFDGGNHTISGLNITGTEYNVGLFGKAVGATISNLKVSAGSIAGDDNVGVLAGRLIDCTITNCSVSGATAVSLANSADNSTALSDCQNKPCDVTLSGRTLYKDGSWNTICLPFDYDPAYGVLAGDGVEIYALTNAEIAGTRLNLFFGENVAGNNVMHAGKPYIIKWNNTGVHLSNPVFQGVVPRVTVPVDYDNGASDGAKVRFRGTFSPQHLPAQDQSILFMGGDNTLYYPKSGTGTTIGACRAYFQIGSGTAAPQLDNFDFTFGEKNVTRLKEIDNGQLIMDNWIEGVWYTLDGRRLSVKPTQKGIYIINGKKGVIK